MCFCCDTDYNIIDHLPSSKGHLFCWIYDESEGKYFAIVNVKRRYANKKICI